MSLPMLTSTLADQFALGRIQAVRPLARQSAYLLVSLPFQSARKPSDP